ncbi:hypothetical protein IW262DRAFT_376372 [Armillaria fumosa]|nr:hypothetical protein IW262DRAFT_376372 [Armillaria fumosa]
MLASSCTARRNSLRATMDFQEPTSAVDIEGESDGHWEQALEYDDEDHSSSRYNMDEEYTNLPKVTLTSLTETGQDEWTIPVLKQRSYTGRKVIPSALADALCADLRVNGVLEELNTMLGTSYPLDSVISILDSYIAQNVDFGTAYAYLRPYWYDIPTIEHELRAREEKDREMRRSVLVDDRITTLDVPPRRVWDLCANRVVPYWVACDEPRGISHVWVDAKDRVNYMTPINGYEWPVPIPKDANLELVRIEMLNQPRLEAEYVWLDVLCLRQEGGKGEHLRLDEWKLDVPTIGSVYERAYSVVYHFNGLGRPLHLTPDYFESDCGWFQRARMPQQITAHPIIGGETDDDVMEEDVRRTFYMQLLSKDQRMPPSKTILDFASEMESTVHINFACKMDTEYTNLPTVTLTSLTETGQDESMIPVLRQRSYTGRKVIPSALADTLCADLGVDGVLKNLNTVLGTSYTLDSVNSILNFYITRNSDFGTAYTYLRPHWNKISTIEHKLSIWEEKDREMRRNVLTDGSITTRHLSPRRVWDLNANRVVPYWVARREPWAISHAWLDEKDREYVMTPINGRQWPVPMPKDANLDLIRIEILNTRSRRAPHLEAEYAWLDVLCLRQEGGKSKDLHLDEWKLDVPTIGSVYERAYSVVFYFNGLGHPLHFAPGYFESDRCWFRRAWTLQEITANPIIGGETDSDVMEEDVRRRFDEQMTSLQRIRRSTWILDLVFEMKHRVSTKPLDKVAGLVYLLRPAVVPVYDAKQSPADAWEVLMDVMGPELQAQLLFLYPEPGDGRK